LSSGRNPSRDRCFAANFLALGSSDKPFKSVKPV
jgi:hypothetical protein